jgi:cation transport ATPase
MNWFVPVVLCIAIGAALFWIFFGKNLVGNAYISIAVASFIGVLVIACPCGIGLATPMAVTTWVGHLAKNGILSKNAEWLLKLRKATRFLFDKTGTLTQWKPQVVAEEFFWDKKQIAEILYALESLANHPLAEAVSKHYLGYKNQDIQVQDFWTIVWAGVRGTINGQRYIAASPTYLIEQWYSIDAQKISTLTIQAMTPICLVDEKQVLAILGIADTIKQEAIDTVKYLLDTGKEVIMISWDHPDVVASIANKLWITNYYAGVKPEEKAELVRKISRKQEAQEVNCNDWCCPPQKWNIKNNDFIVMVWDGINDAPALAQADIGIAMSTGTDIAIESADMTLLHGDISKLRKAIEISKLTHSAIVQNLFRAFSYNIIGIPLAAGAFYLPFGLLLNPAFEGAAMAMSDLMVIGNSIRLQRKKI